MSLYIDSKYTKLVAHRLRNFKQKNDYLWNFSCPFCGDSQKNKLKARGYVYQKGNDLFYRCHNCGIGTNVAGLIKQLDPELHKEYTLERYKSGQSNYTRTANSMFDVPTPKFGKLSKQSNFEYAEWVDRLPTEHYCLSYVTKRKIPSKFYKNLLFTRNYNQFVTTLIPNHGKTLIDDARLVIPYYNEYDELIAVSGRALETSDKTLRYITIRTKESKDKLLFGMDRVNLNETVYVVEGPIDSLFLENCVASGDANLMIAAKSIPSSKKVLIFDNEPRNKEVVKLIENAVKSQHNVVIWPNTVIGKDINEMVMNGLSPDEILRIISSNTFSGLEAQAKFIFWKKV